MKHFYRLILPVLVIAVMILSVAGATFSWFVSDSGSIGSTFSAGTLDVDIQFPDAVFSRLASQANYTSVVHFDNESTSAANVRLYMVPEWQEYDAASDTFRAVALPAQNITLSIASPGWTLRDGYYYLDERLLAKQDLDVTVELDTKELDSSYDGKRVRVKIYVELA